MKTYITILALFFVTSSSFAQKTDTVNWLTFEQLSDSLQVKPKKTLLFFHTDWCVYCRKMMKATFTEAPVIKHLNEHYYVVQFDAESIDPIRFDGQLLTNAAVKKQTGKYHDIAKLLASKKGKLTFPTTIILNSDFTVKQRFFQYLDQKKLMQVLKVSHSK